MKELTNEIRKEIEDFIFDYYAYECEVEREEITMETNLQEELGGSSLMFVELVEMASEKYNLDIKLQNVGKYIIRYPVHTMQDVFDVFCKIYLYGNDIVNRS